MQQIPLFAEAVPSEGNKTFYPEPFASRVEGREKRKLGNYFGLSNFGINLTRLAPGAVSALLHSHSKQDEFIYVLEGTATLITLDNEYTMRPGDCFGVKAGSGMACQLVNQSGTMVKFLEIGDRSAGDKVDYPNDDLKAEFVANGEWKFAHKDGRPY